MSISVCLADNLKPVPINLFPDHEFAADYAHEAIKDFKAIVDLILEHAETENPDYWDACIDIVLLDDSVQCSSTGYPEFEIDGENAIFTVQGYDLGIEDDEDEAFSEFPLTIPILSIKTLHFSYDT